MPTKSHTQEQIVAVLREGEAGEKVADIFARAELPIDDLRWNG